MHGESASPHWPFGMGGHVFPPIPLEQQRVTIMRAFDKPRGGIPTWFWLALLATLAIVIWQVR